MMKRRMVLVVSVCCLLAAVGCNRKSQRPDEPSESDGLPTLHEVLVADVEEKIAPPPADAAPAAAPATTETPATPAAPAPAAPAAATPQPEPEPVAAAQPAKPNPLKAAFDKKDVLAVAEDTPSRPAPKAKAPAPAAAPAEPKDTSPADKNDDKSKAADANPEDQAVRDVVIALCRAVESSNEKDFLGNIAYGKTEEPILKTMYGMSAEMNGLEKDMKKAYGQKGVDLIKKNQQLRVGGSVPSLEDVENKMAVKITGNNARATISNHPQPLSLVKVDGRWKIQLFKPGQLQGPQAQMAMGMMSGMVKGVKNARKMIGKPGVTPEKVMQAISQGMMMPNPAMMKAR